MDMQKILCPACGHHLASIPDPLRQPKTVPGARIEGPVADALPAIAKWIADGDVKGTFEPTELFDAFVTATRDASVSQRAFGLSLKALGYQRHARAGRRLWTI